MTRPLRPKQFKPFKKGRLHETMETGKKHRTNLHDEENQKATKCANLTCERTLQMGDDALMLQRVVIGVQRPVPLEAPRLFHSNECFEEYVCNSDTEKLPKRIP